MLDNLFGYWKKRDEIQNKAGAVESIIAPSKDDGAIEVEVKHGIDSGSYASASAQMFDLDIAINSTNQLIDTYRTVADHYEVDNTIQKIISDAIVFERGHDVVTLNLDKTEFSDSIKEKIKTEFKYIAGRLEFRSRGQEHFKRWYVDSRIHFHKIIDPKNQKNGLIELRRLDSRNIQFVREVITDTVDGIRVVKGINEYYIYTLTDIYSCYGRVYTTGDKIKIPKSAIVYAHSGLLDITGKNIIGHLHRAIKPINQLKMLEDAMVIYRITRAPDRRIFYIDTGTMNARKSTQHMQHIINGLKNRVVYDASTGKIKNQKANMSLTEDIWLQRRDGKAVTEVETLPGMSGMNEFDDVKYFRKAVYLALKVPLSRIPDDVTGQQSLFDAGTNITRDEIEFGKFVGDLQQKFSVIFLDPLKSQLILKNILTEDEWNTEINNITIDYHEDSYFTEIKDAELEERRINLLQQADQYIGKYFSHTTAMKRFLQMTDDEIKEEAKLIEADSKEKRFQPEEDEL